MPIRRLWQAYPCREVCLPPHWFGLSKAQQAEIWAAYRGFLRGKVSPDELRRRQQQVLDEAELQGRGT
jgi:hypothetical protein